MGPEIVESSNDFKWKDYFKSESDIPGCESYFSQLQRDKKICSRQFKLISINENEEIVEHRSFVHSVYRNDEDMQQILISKDLNIMIEKLMNHRVIVYKWSDEKDSWVLSKRFYDYPHELSINSSSMYLFSPSLLRYVHFCKEKKCLVIKYTLL